jgi:hypothetical protein
MSRAGSKVGRPGDECCAVCIALASNKVLRAESVPSTVRDVVGSREARCCRLQSKKLRLP